jgi:hypothetical protein
MFPSGRDIRTPDWPRPLPHRFQSTVYGLYPWSDTTPGQQYRSVCLYPLKLSGCLIGTNYVDLMTNREEPEGSLPHSQELATCSYPEPDQSSPHQPILPLQDTFQYYPPTSILVFLVVSFRLTLLLITYTTRFASHSCYMPRPSHPRLDHSNYTWRRVQITKLLVMQFSPLSCQLIPLRSRHVPQHPVLKHPQSVFPP